MRVLAMPRDVIKCPSVRDVGMPQVFRIIGASLFPQRRKPRRKAGESEIPLLWDFLDIAAGSDIYYLYSKAGAYMGFH